VKNFLSERGKLIENIRLIFNIDIILLAIFYVTLFISRIAEKRFIARQHRKYELLEKEKEIFNEYLRNHGLKEL
jgi:hypothetical protein